MRDTLPTYLAPPLSAAEGSGGVNLPTRCMCGMMLTTLMPTKGAVLMAGPASLFHLTINHGMESKVWLRPLPWDRQDHLELLSVVES